MVLKGPANITALGKHFEYTIDPAWQLTVQNFIAPTATPTEPLPRPVPDFGYTAAKIWLKLPIINQSADHQDWRFAVHTNFTQAISIYQIGEDGTVKTLLDLGQDSPFSARPLNYPQIVAAFKLNAGEAATIVVSYFSQGSSRLSMSIDTPESYLAQASVSEAKYYAFYGMMLIMITLSLVAFIVIKQSLFIFYASYFLSILMYVCHADGVAFQYIWPNFPRFNSMASMVAAIGIMVFASLFAMTYLQTKRFHPFMHRILLGQIAMVLTISAVLWPTDPQLLKRIFVIMLSVCTLCCLSAGLIAGWKRFSEVRFYLLAYTAALIPALLFTMRHAFGYEPSFIGTYDAVRLALIVDALMMGLAIFDRYNFQRQSAFAQTLAEAQKNLSLSQRLGTLEAQYQMVNANSLLREENVKDTIHDLRQPMQALRLSLGQMLDPQQSNSKDKGQVESALAYMERLVAGRLAENDAAPTTNAKAASDLNLQSQPQEPGLYEVLRGITDMFASEAQSKGLGLKLVLAAPDAEIAAYPLMRVVSNLVSNAIKYTKHGRIIVSLRRHGSGHCVEVHDTGPGLNAAEFETALIRNQRLERDLDAAEGSGLGLSVVSGIAKANNWTITACQARTSGTSIRVSM